MARDLTGVCPICKEGFLLKIEESIIDSATSFPVVFSTQHCSHALICYIDGNFTIRMIEIAHIAQTSNSSAAQETLSPEIPLSESETEMMELSDLKKEQRIILECTITKSQVGEHKFPNIVEKQIFFQILKHGNLTLDRLLEELKVIQSALNIEISGETLSPIIDKYVKAGLLKKSVI
ncbi:MAG: hypothetical protein ACTSRK_10780 [Promethearchaeota archaeon]